MVCLAAQWGLLDWDALVKSWNFFLVLHCVKLKTCSLKTSLPLSEGMAIARRLMPFGVQRLLYSGRTAKAEAAEVKGEFGKKTYKKTI